MASKASATIALLLTLNLLFFSMANANQCPQATLDVCVGGLGGLLSLVPLPNPGCACCQSLLGLVDLDLDACLCAIIKLDVLGALGLSVDLQFSRLLDYCGIPARACPC